MIAVMARVPVPGAAKTRLAPALGADGAAALAAAMAGDVLDTVRATGLPYRVCVAGPMASAWVAELGGGCFLGVEAQPDGDLGARLAHALRDGGVAIGTDAPLLSAGLLRTAADALARGWADVVLAPAQDGGYVLVGCVARLAASMFEGVPWSSDTTFRAQVARCHALGVSPLVLPGGADVDTPGDLERLRADLRAASALAPRTRAFLEALDAAPLR